MPALRLSTDLATPNRFQLSELREREMLLRLISARHIWRPSALVSREYAFLNEPSGGRRQQPSRPLNLKCKSLGVAIEACSEGNSTLCSLLWGWVCR